MARLFGKDASDGLVTELSPILIPNFTTFYYSVAIPHYWGQVTKSNEGIGEPEVFVSCRHSFGRESLETGVAWNWLWEYRTQLGLAPLDIGGLPVGIWKGFRSGLGIFSRQNLESQLLYSRFSNI